MFFRKIRLHAFVKANPPHAGNRPAVPAMLARHAGRVPEALIELWQKHGLGWYGARQWCLVDPDVWQPVLDRWIVSAGDDTVRVPIALSAFGHLIYYRRLTDEDEDVAALDPVRRDGGVLAWSLVESFNEVLTDDAQCDALVPPERLALARETAGGLAPGEVYEVAPQILPFLPPEIARVDALAMHRRLRDKVDEEAAAPPDTVGTALPDDYRDAFTVVPQASAAAPAAGMYFTSHFDRHRLLALTDDGRFRLLLWSTDVRAHRPAPPRCYEGTYAQETLANGDLRITLGLHVPTSAPGGDWDDEVLYPMQAQGTRWLLRANALAGLADAIGWRGRWQEPDDYFQAATLASAIPPYRDDGIAAPGLAELPASLREQVRVAPLTLAITAVAPPGDEDDDTVMVAVRPGAGHGLRMNMPMCSPAGSGRNLIGWVWDIGEEECGLGVRVTRDEDGRIVDGPRVGDVLVSRHPDGGPVA